MNNKFVLFIRIQLRAVGYSGLQGLRHTLFHSELAMLLALANEMFTTAVGTGESVLVAVLSPLPRLCICSSHHEEKNLLCLLEGERPGEWSLDYRRPSKVTPQLAYAQACKQFR